MILILLIFIIDLIINLMSGSRYDYEMRKHHLPCFGNTQKLLGPKPLFLM